MLTFLEMICSPPFNRSEILCGWKGKEKPFIQVETEWSSFDKPTFIMIANNIDHVLQLVDYLSTPNIEGILLYGAGEINLPQSIVDEMDSMNKPVLLLKEEVKPTQLKKTILELQQLKSLGLYHFVYEQSTQYWLQLFHNHRLETVINRLTLLIDQEIILIDEHFYLHPLSLGNRSTTHVRHLRSLYYEKAIKQDKNKLTIIDDGQRHYFLFPLFSVNQRYGFLLFQEQSGRMIDICTELVVHALPAMISYFEKEEAVLSAHKSYKDDFLYNLLYNNLESEQQLLKKGKQWGWDFEKPAELMVIRINQKSENLNVNIDIEAKMSKIRSLMSARFLQAITFLLQSDIVIIVFDPSHYSTKAKKEFTKSLAQQIHKVMEQDYPNLEYEIGIGRHYPSNMELFRSFHEAKIALELGKYEMKQNPVRHFEDIGIARLLSNIHHHILHEYYQEVLKDLLSDRENSQMYLDTLSAYYKYNGDINQTAEQLFVHPNTLRKRLKKIESILNIDFNQLDDLLEIYVAVILLKMLK